MPQQKRPLKRVFEAAKRVFEASGEAQASLFELEPLRQPCPPRACRRRGTSARFEETMLDEETMLADEEMMPAWRPLRRASSEPL